TLIFSQNMSAKANKTANIETPNFTFLDIS
ncbi:MAG: hypothetical protein ACI82H_002306, partial [Alphaproteobacteria bacterium]